MSTATEKNQQTYRRQNANKLFHHYTPSVRASQRMSHSLLNFVLEHGLEALKASDLEEMLGFANAAAYLVTTKKGAIRSMPEREQVLKLL